jgi:membrane protease YdiL (CAAX protease family)
MNEGVTGSGRGDGRGWLRPVAAYVALAYLLTWSWWVPLAFDGQTVDRGDASPTHVPGLLGPMVAALLATALLNGRAGLLDLAARLVRWRVGWRWWVVALSPAAFALAALPVARAIEDEWPAWSSLGRFNGLPDTGVLTMWLLLTLVNGYGEETGWRGYLLPHLQRRFSPLGATAIVAAVWALWHAPAFFMLESYKGFNAAMLAGFVIGLACGAVVLTWLYNRSDGSVLLVAVWHGTYNLVSGTEGAEGVIQIVVSGLVIALAIHLVVREMHAWRAGEQGVLGSRS